LVAASLPPSSELPESEEPESDEASGCEVEASSWLSWSTSICSKPSAVVYACFSAVVPLRTLAGSSD